MSGIAGVYHLDGAPADAGLLARMTGALAHRGPDGEGLWHGGSVAFGHKLLCTTPESVRERQPLADESGQFVLVLDGRVDNRDELRGELRAQGESLRDDTDAELVLKACRCWKEEAPRRILGDFAFACWDAVSRVLLCARDPLGLKPFYYRAGARAFLFASEPQALLVDPSAPRIPNEGMLGEYLACRITHKEETLFKDLLRLPPGHGLSVEPGRVRKARYWDLDPRRTVRYARDEEYAEHFRELFQDAVRKRLRSHRSVASDLSGGLDSSSIVSVGADLLRRGAAPCPGLEAFSLVFPGLACDESSYIHAVALQAALPSHRVDLALGWDVDYEELARGYADFPAHPNGAMSFPCKSLMRGRGMRVVLSGMGGDDWFQGSYPLNRLRDLWAQRDFSAAFRQARRVPLATLGSFLAREALKRLLPAGPLRALRTRAGLRRMPPWLHRRFVERSGLLERLFGEFPVPEGMSRTQEYHYRNATGGWQVHALEMEERQAARYGLELRLPFEDRRLVEFSMALPEEQRVRNGLTKFILREALKGLLPETVRARTTKAHFNHIVSLALRKIGAETRLADLAFGKLEWIDERKVEQAYRNLLQWEARGERGFIPLAWPLWMVFGMEIWYKQAVAGRANLK